MADSRVLVRDGKWVVPPEDRPQGWERILPEPPSPAAPAPIEAHLEAALPETVTGPSLEQIVEQTVTVQAVVPTCGCGRPVKHPGMCKIRAAKAAETRRPFFEFARDIRESWKEFDGGQNERLLWAALIMVAGMWTHRPHLLKRMVGCTRAFVEATIPRLYDAHVWERGDYGVRLGIDIDHGDLGLWLNAMVAAGQIDGDAKEERYWALGFRPRKRVRQKVKAGG